LAGARAGAVAALEFMMQNGLPSDRLESVSSLADTRPFNPESHRDHPIRMLASSSRHGSHGLPISAKRYSAKTTGKEVRQRTLSLMLICCWTTSA